MSEKRVLPQSELDFNLMTTDSVWGRSDVSPELRSRLEKYYMQVNDAGENVITRESLWGLLGFYTRDMRLANLSIFFGEVAYCQYHLDLANDFLQKDMIQPFLVSLSRAATLLELSQSKSGFLRKSMNTFRTENTQTINEPTKKKLFGGSDKKDFGGGY